MATKSKLYAYVRFSTADQAKGDSLRRQTKKAAEYAALHGFTLDTDLTLHDLGVSGRYGKNASKGALGLFLRAVEDGLVPVGSCLFVEDEDRLSRQGFWDALPTLQLIINNGVSIGVDREQPLDLKTLRGPTGMYALNRLVMKLELAAAESAKKADRLKAAWSRKRAAAADEVLTARVPAWCEVGADRQVKLIDKRAKVVRRVFDLFLEGVGMHSIAAALNSEKVPRFGRAAFWSASYVFKILNNPAVTGVYTPHLTEVDAHGRKTRRPQDPVPGYYPTVIDAETYERAQALNSAMPRGRKPVVANLLANLARCPKCGAAMNRVSKGRGKKQASPVYVCSRARNGAGCKYVPVRVHDIETAILDRARDFPSVCPHPDATAQKELDAVEQALWATNEKIQNVVDAISVRPSAALSDKLAKLEAEATELRAVRIELATRAAQTDSKLVKRRAARLADALSPKNIDRQQANAAMRECFETVVIDHVRCELRLTWRHGGEMKFLYAWPDDSKAVA